MLEDMSPQDMNNATKGKAKTPPDARVYAIGDVHGRLDLLDDLLGQIRADADAALKGKKPPQRLVVVMLGDLIDRGPDSAGVLKRAAELLKGKHLPGFEAHILKGNHEDAMERFLADDDDGRQWRANGGREALQSYGLDADQDSDALRAQLRDALPKAHRRVLGALKLSHVEGDYAFVHAGVRPGVAWNKQSPDDLLWIRREFTDSDADFGRCVVHGHTPTDAPEVRANRIGIDTRAWSSGVLTALVVDGKSRRFLST